MPGLWAASLAWSRRLPCYNPVRILREVTHDLSQNGFNLEGRGALTEA